jgi:bla regulator protein BlaR1
VRHPVIALPAAAATWTPERLRLVLVHELVHVRRQDVLVEGLLWLAGALYWFHPAVWLAAGRLRLERRVRALLTTPGAVLIYALGTVAPCASAW